MKRKDKIGTQTAKKVLIFPNYFHFIINIWIGWHYY